MPRMNGYIRKVVIQAGFQHCSAYQSCYSHRP
jgi:hypothetical protein